MKKKIKKYKKVYMLSPKIKWKTFKLLQKKFVRDVGPTPQSMDKVLWGMLKENLIYCWFCDEKKRDMGIGVKLPEAKEYITIE